MRPLGEDKRVKALMMYAVSVAICLALLTLSLQLWDADLSVPFDYDWDAVQYGMMVKGMIDNGWLLENPWLGAPGTLQLYEFPVYDNLDFFLMKLISLVTPDFAFTLNFYYLLTFPLVVITSMLALRQLKVSYPVAIVVSQLCAFLPYHFMHGIDHIVLSSYFMVPLMILACIWLFKGEVSFFGRDKDTGRPRLATSPKALACVLICILTSFTMLYFVYFAFFLLFISGVLAAIIWKKYTPLATALVLLIFLAAGCFFSFLPNVLYILEHGRTLVTYSRLPGYSEFFGLKMTQMFIPFIGHRIPDLSNLSIAYSSLTPVRGSHMEYLGIAGIIGFMALLAWIALKYRPGASKNQGPADALSLLNISSFLFATVSGFGAIAAYLVLPEIRCYERMGLYISFYSLFMVALMLQYAYDRLKTDKALKISFIAFLCVVLLAGVYDQTSPEFIPQYEKLKADYVSDKDFIGKIESTMPAGSMIFQLPVTGFPEAPSKVLMYDYDLFKGYLHSKSLKWSYGAIRGGEEDKWQQGLNTADSLNETVIKGIIEAGFAGIYVDKYGYGHDSDYPNYVLKEKMGLTPIVSEDGRLYFYDLRPYAEKNKRP